jgi:hypothetical protein
LHPINPAARTKAIKIFIVGSLIVIITTKNDLTYEPNIRIPAGTDASILTVRGADNLPRGEKNTLLRARDRYKKFGRKGVFAYLGGRYRWVDREDYR